ncbi:MAG: STAS domain-containing protein [Planctomycetota bacterium]
MVGDLDIIPGREPGSVIIGPGEPSRSRHEPERPEPMADFVEISADGGVVTAKIVAPSVEERPANIILAKTREAMEQIGDGLTNVVLDFGDVDFINSSGLAACLELRNGAAEKGARTILYQPRDDVLQVFTMVKVDRLFTTAHTAEELTNLVT